MSESLRDKIINASDLDSEMFHSDKWGVDILVCEMDCGCRTRFWLSVDDGKGNVDGEKFIPLLVIATCRDPETKEAIFTKDDFDVLNGKNGEEMNALALVAKNVNGFAEDKDSKNG